ncbi:MscS Mechanosensitive ion channel [Denitrovibrio acetiphilus DSM 12809]|uniref:MscS Mechanosensitive ion channel n=1 Tax=Denitrovibrio acetiphilus (strain DSM 12809 / NBRC 114555 / N2460) TaxID=522772 RepID=D4H300_DENA2|nr:mechanosensitive ion channel domain-containing protein [Denitrovibrio acetiphilus]ADD69023.1 MscS Mechanosensitive ion channel [Denitrovibrio acetiphilus DSM 12809]
MDKFTAFIENWMLTNGLNIIYALLIFIVGHYIAKIIAKVAGKALGKASVEITLSRFLTKLIYYMLLAAVVIAALNRLGIETTSVVAVFATAGLAIGLALKDSLSNLAAGVMIIIFKPFIIGNFVEAAGTSGIVDEISIFTTKLKTPDNKIIIIPNSAVLGANITNYSAQLTRRVDITIGVGYESDIKKVKDILKGIIAETTTILPDPEPVVVLSNLGESSIDFTMRSWVNTDDYWPTYFDMLEQIKMKLDDAGVNIPFPQMDIHIRKEEEK